MPSRRRRKKTKPPKQSAAKSELRSGDPSGSENGGASPTGTVGDPLDGVKSLERRTLLKTIRSVGASRMETREPLARKTPGYEYAPQLKLLNRRIPGIFSTVPEMGLTELTRALAALEKLESITPDEAPKDLLLGALAAIDAATEFRNYVKRAVNRKLSRFLVPRDSEFQFLSGPILEIVNRLRAELSQEQPRPKNDELRAKGLLNSTEVAVILGVNDSRVRQLARGGCIHNIRSHEGDFWFDSAEVDRFKSIERRPGPKPKAASK
jgi:hypothetical protein